MKVVVFLCVIHCAVFALGLNISGSGMLMITACSQRSPIIHKLLFSFHRWLVHLIVVRRRFFDVCLTHL